MLMADSITTARLFLRRFRAEDAAAFHPILSDPEAMRYWSTPPHRDFSETEAWIAKTIEAVDKGEADDFIALSEGAGIGKAGRRSGNGIGMIFAPAMRFSTMPDRRFSMSPRPTLPGSGPSAFSARAAEGS